MTAVLGLASRAGMISGVEARAGAPAYLPDGGQFPAQAGGRPQPSAIPLFCK